MALGNHRYWRLDALQNQTATPSGFNQLCEFYFRQTVGGANEVPVAGLAGSTWSGANSIDKAYDGNSATYWMQNFGDAPWVAFDFGAAITPEELYLQASTGDNFNRSLRTAVLSYSDTSINGPWAYAFGVAFPAWTADGQIQTVDLTAPADEELVTKAGFVVADIAEINLKASKAGFVGIVNFPTEFELASKAGMVPVTLTYQTILTSKASVVAVVRGRTTHPNIVSWTFSLDGHEFYVLQMQQETLLYDFHAERWYCWGSGETPLWNVQVGQNWNANVGLIISEIGGGERTSNIVVGDGTTSMLYFLDPELSEDYSSAGEPGKKFLRVITGQLVARGTAYVKLPYVDVQSSEGDTVTASDLSVELMVSDDQGHSYWSAGEKTVVLGQYAISLNWRSLGSYKSPGRLLKLVDHGAIVRVDDWTTPDDG